MHNELVPVSSLPLGVRGASRSRRKATTLDGVRTRAFLERVGQGEDELAAFWAVASDPAMGLARFRGQTERPPELVLRRKLAAMLERTSPSLLSGARDVALARLATLSDDALVALAEIVTGDFSDGRAARARLDAAKTILQSLGIGERSGMTVATQVNVTSSALAGVPDGA